MLIRVSIDAFALSPDVAEVLKAVRDDRAFAKARMEVLPGGLAGAAAHYQDEPSPQVIVVEAEGDEATVLAQMDELAEVVEPGTRVIVVGDLNDITFYRTLMGHGISEYLLRPVAPRQVLDAISNLFADPGASPKGKLVAFWSARGGAGSSTLAQNMASTMGKLLPEPAIYMDFDLAFGTSLLSFNLEARQTMVEALSQPDRLDPVLLERFLADASPHLKVLASSGDIRQCPAVSFEAVDKLLELACRMAPVVVADLPHLWADWTEHMLVEADEVVVVATPDLASLRDAKAVLDLLASRRGAAAPARLVLNKLDAYKKTQLTPKDFEETLKLKPALALAFDPALFGQAANNGQMLADAGRTAKVNEALAAFAQTLSGAAPAKKAAKPKGLLGWLKR